MIMRLTTLPPLHLLTLLSKILPSFPQHLYHLWSQLSNLRVLIVPAVLKAHKAIKLDTLLPQSHGSHRNRCSSVIDDMCILLCSLR